MKFVELSILGESSKTQLLGLWNEEYPVKLSFQNTTEFDNYLGGLINLKHILLVNEVAEIEGWAFSFERENLRWFAIILSENIQGMGYGKKLLDKLKSSEKELNGWVIDHNSDKKLNGEVYKSPLEFYIKCGFEVISNQRLELEKLSAVRIKWIIKS